ncbi:MAG: hypothetical protein ACI93P_000995 [bacterium]|jgi:hypothetical protein
MLKTKQRQKDYNSLDTMLDDIDKDLEIIGPIADNEITKIKSLNMFTQVILLRYHLFITEVFPI